LERKDLKRQSQQRTPKRTPIGSDARIGHRSVTVTRRWSSKSSASTFQA
jgi:hypothetical protein